ncbi:hypothetical protein D9758_018607 [Tetrapyrgos nigripes]|uniref:Uncharacterized protein n=1 Tax=Tetrapyrgos nigripes TaxID=182062 RepID=A0A8H5BCZ1_9AGAR|nr:hypothetical protein D9758_018607 [Tetrapyrgos nigripes]
MSCSFDSMNPPPRSEAIPQSTWMGLYFTTLHHATLVSAEKLVNSFREYVWGEECLYQPEFSFSFLLEFRGAWLGVFVKGGVGLVSGVSSSFNCFSRGGGGQALGVKVAKEGKRRVKGRLVLGFGAWLPNAQHSFGSGSSVDYGDDTAGADVGSNIVDSWIGEKNRLNLKRDVRWYIAHSKIVSTSYLHCKNNISNGNWTIASYGAYLQELNIWTSVYTRGFTAVASGL